MKRSVVFLVIFSLLFDQIPFYTLQQNIKQREAPLVVEESRTLNYDVQTTYPIEEAPLEEPLDDTSPSNTYPIEGLNINGDPVTQEMLSEEALASPIVEEPEDVPLFEPSIPAEPSAQSFSPWIKLAVEPSIYIAGKNIHVSWSLQDATNLRLDGTEQLAINLTDGLLPVDEKMAAQYLEEGVLTLPVTSLEGQIDLQQTTLPASTKIGLNIALKQDGLSLDINAATLTVYDSETQPPLTTPENRFGVSLSQLQELPDQNLVFSIDVPSQHTLPAISLTGDPIEILAVDLETGLNVNQFSSPITLTVPYKTDHLLPEQEADLQLFYYNPTNAEWYPMETVVDTVNKTLTAATDHLTVFDYKAANWQSYVPPLLENYQVSEFTGAATYQMDFPAFEGPNGLKPNLTLSYNSQIIDEGSAYTQASWVGMGWSLETGLITRDMHGTDAVLTDDTYMLSLNGLSGRLLPISSSGTKTNYALGAR